jgi:hypothetical protein
MPAKAIAFFRFFCGQMVVELLLASWSASGPIARRARVCDFSAIEE